jgi:hypothetical protein
MKDSPGAGRLIRATPIIAARFNNDAVAVSNF